MNVEEQINENMGFTKAEVLKMKEDLSNFLDKYSLYNGSRRHR